MIGPVPIGRLGGIPILLGVSWAGLLPVVAFGMFVGVSPSSGSLALRTAVAGAGALLVLVSVVVHEVGHVIAARRHAVVTERVLIFALGGYSEIDLGGAVPAAAIRIALAGPAVSALAGAAFVAVSSVSLDTGGVSVVLSTVGVINLGVAVFNLLPAFPLDGGRIVQGWLQARGRSLADARRATARGAGALGLLLIGGGVVLSIIGVAASLLTVPIGIILLGLALAGLRGESAKTAEVI